MRSAHIAIGAVSIVPSGACAVALLLFPDPFDTGSAALIAVGLMIATVTALSGLLLARAPWGQWGLIATTIIAMATASVLGGAAMWVTLIAGAVALVGLLGPWLRLWVRHQTLAESPGPIPITLTSVGAVATLYVGFCAAQGAHWSHVLVAAITVVGSVLYGRGNRIGIMVLRIAVPITAAFAAANTEPLGAVALLLGGVTIGVLAWLPAASRTTKVITPPLPTPVDRRP